MNIIITGASKGIGFELAKYFSKNKDNTVLAIARNEELLSKLKNICAKSEYQGNIETLVSDLEDFKMIKNNLANKVLMYFNSIDILINNAGYLINKDFEEISIQEIQKSFNINYIGHTVLIQELLPLLKQSKVGHVVNISSMGGFQGSAKFPGLSIYSSSKAALAVLTECLAEEYKSTNIKFNCLALGAANTEMLEKAFPGYNAPLNANEMAQFIYDFACTGYKYFNGKILPVSVSTP